MQLAEHRYQQAKHITLVNVLVNLLLGFSKIIFGWLGSSQALVADGIHSFSDLIPSFLVLFAIKYGSQAADQDHPYGHQRIETAATVGLAVLLIFVSFAIILDGGWRLVVARTFSTPHWSVLVIAVISVLANEWLFRYSLRLAKKINSDLLRANAWHNRSDAASSLVVLLGVTGAYFGFMFLDEVAAIVVGAMILRMGWELGWSSLRELVDTSPEPEALAEIKKTILTIKGVKGIHDLRARFMGGRVFVDVHVLVDDFLSVSEGHFIGEQVLASLLNDHELVIDVVVHVDAEDDRQADLNTTLPTRAKLLEILHQQFSGLPAQAQIKRIVLHYLSGKIAIEIWLPLQALTAITEVRAWQEQYQTAVAHLPYIRSLQLLFSE